MAMATKTDKEMPLLEHLTELRRRFIVCAAAIAAGSLLSAFFSKTILAILLAPLIKVAPESARYLIFTGPAEAFVTYLKVSIISGLFISSPIILYEIWAFVSPGLKDKEKKFVLPFLLFSSFLFVGGTLFGYLIVFPAAFRFLLSYSTEFIKPLLSLKESLKFSFVLLIGFGIAFELPIFLILLSKTGVVDSKKLKRLRGIAIIIIFTFSAILTPPDILSQILMAAPLTFLYELSIILIKVLERKKERLAG